MELNTRGRYAVTAMADIAKHAGDDAVPLSAISERQHISLAYLEQIFLRLRRAGLVESARGRAGGYRLGRAPDQITVAEVMAAVEEEVRMTRCAGELGNPCHGKERCLTHGLWDALVDAATFEAMRKDGDKLMPQARATFEGGSSRFLFKGTNERWREVLTGEDIALYEAKAAKEMTPACAAWVARGRLEAGDPRTLAD